METGFLKRTHKDIAGEFVKLSPWRQRITNVLTVTLLTIEQEIRRQLLYAIAFFGFIYLFAVATLHFFGLSFQERLYFDMALTGLGWFQVILAIVLSINSMAQEIEKKTIYPLLSRPITRAQYVVGKFLGVTFFLVIVWLLFTSEIIITYIWVKREALISGTNQYWMYVAPLSYKIVAATFLLLLKSMITSLVVFILSLFVTPPVNFSLTILFFTLAEMSMAYLKVIRESLGNVATLFKVMKFILPYFDFFNIRGAVVFQERVTPGYIAFVVLYGIVYILFLLELLIYFVETRDL